MGEEESVSTGILTDNLRWLPDGALLAGGQDSSMPAVFQCRPPACRVGSAAIRIDTATGKTSRLATYAGSEAFEGGTTALQVGNEVAVRELQGHAHCTGFAGSVEGSGKPSIAGRPRAILAKACRSPLSRPAIEGSSSTSVTRRDTHVVMDGPGHF